MFLIKGEIITGKKRGKDLGFPTANVLCDKSTPQGIYISYLSIDGNMYPSVTFIGNATTFNEDDIKSETYILDFDQNIYGKMVTIELIQKIRDNAKFESVEKLVQEMNQDVEIARKYFQKNT